MPSGTFHLKELDSDKITLDGTLSVSGASTLKGDVALSSNLTVAGDTALANTSASNVDVDGTLSVSGITTIGGHILPSVNDAFDIGSPEFKIRDLYVSDNSLWIGDVTKISFSGGKMKFRKRKTDVVPAAILQAGRNAGHQNDQATVESALAHFNKSSLTDMKLFHWQKYMRDVLSVAAEITDIFRDNDDDYEETSASDAWKEIDDTKIYTTTHVGIGTSDPEEALHIRGAIKVEDGFSLARNEGNNPSLIIDTANFGLDETVNDLTGMGNTKYTKLYRVYGTNSEGVGKNWYWGYADDNYTRFSLSFDGGVGGPPDPDIAFVFTTSSELHCNAVHAALVGNADTATRLQTARTINGVAFDGSADITVGIDGITSSNNNIGIGTSDPKQKLHVNGNMYLTSGETGNFIHGDKRLALQSDATVLIVCDTNDTTGEGSSGDIIFGSGSSYDTNNNKDFTWSQAYSHGNNPRNERMRIKGTGQVGIGTDNPAYILDVQTSDFDNARFKRTVAGGGVGVQLENGDGDVWNIGTGGSGQFGIYRDGQEFGTDFYMADNGRVGIGTTSPTNPLHVQSTTTGTHTMRVTHTDTAATGGSHGLIIDANYSGSDTFEGDKANAGIYIDMDSSATGGGTTHEHRMYGVYSDVRHTGDSDIVYGGWFFARSDHAEGTNTALRGIATTAQDSGLGTNSQVYGGEFKALKDGGSTNTTPTMIGIRAEVEVDAGTATNAYGVSSVIDRDGGTITNGYLFYGAYQGTNVTNNWGIYSAGATKNYLSGNVGIGVSDPVAKLHVQSTAREALHIQKTANGGGVGISFADLTDNSQIGFLTYYHQNTESYGTGNMFKLHSTESSETLALGGSLMIGVDGKDSGDTGAQRKQLFFNSTYGGRAAGTMNYGWWFGTQNQRMLTTDNDFYFTVMRNGTASSVAMMQDDTNGAEFRMNNFTGQHRTFVKGMPANKIEGKDGLIVCADQNEFIRMSGGVVKGNDAITVNESLPVVSISLKAKDKKCFGVISYAEDPNTRSERYGVFTSIIQKEEGDTRVYVNSVGEGGVWVINSNGSLESGDYITTSDVPGYGMKQDDDLLHNYTVAKILMDCDFNPHIQKKQDILKELTTVDYWIRYGKEKIDTDEYEGLPVGEREIKDGECFRIIQEEVLKYDPESEFFVHEAREELKNVLDINGEFQWQELDEEESAYKIRYLDATGEIVTEKDKAVHVAAFVGCTYHCG